VSHTASARKYRPRTFSDVATQGHVSETLRRAVATGRVGHAYLFCGPRGVGKTTLARVLAMALNCPDRTNEGEPCGVCESCARIWGGHTALDVVEIDAASNRGVDDARDLRERAMYAPSEEGRFKVYIVDEAHMLTREAWNALLKILEEPPPRVIFVFATTEPQKIQQMAAPILSRCQRFDFRRIGVADIVQQLGAVLTAEKGKAPEAALRIIARKANGGMRDGLSLLDQVIALTGGEITQESVRRVLGLVEEERYLELFDLLAESRHAKIFRFVEALLDEGYDLVEFYHGLVESLRSLLRISLGDSMAELGEELQRAMSERAAAFRPADLVRMLALASDLEMGGSLRRTTQPQVLIEMLLLRLSYMDSTVSLSDMLQGLGGSPPPDGGAGREAGGGTQGRQTANRAEPAAHRTQGEPTDLVESVDSQQGGTSGEEMELPLMQAWEAALDDGAGIPGGMTTLLRAAAVGECPGGLIASVPDGPLLERLSDPRLLRAIADAVSRFTGSPVTFQVQTNDSGRADPERITEGSVKEGRLRELVEQEPLLQRAVEELDLELMD
jgi:DNA polymerase III subunit gamma/tau